MPDLKKKIPDLTLEQYLLGELPIEEKRQLETRLALDFDLKDRLAALKLSDREILDTCKTETMVSSIIRKAHLDEVKENLKAEKRKNKLTTRIKYLAPAMGLAAVLLVTLIPDYRKVPGRSDQVHDTRIKGLHLQVFMEKNEQQVMLKDGDTVSEGDILQIRYISPGRKYGAIFSIDGNKNLTMHYPENKTGFAELSLTGKVSLPHAYELDNAPDFEKFYFVSSDDPAKIEKLFENLREMDFNDSGIPEPALTEGLEKEVVSLKKVSP